jgi:hypothetical protein
MTEKYPGRKNTRKKKWWRDTDVVTKRQKPGIGWKIRKEAAECAMRREKQSSIRGMDVAKWVEGGKGTGRNTEWRRKGDKMDERHMEEKGKKRAGEGWGIGIKIGYFWNFLELLF